MSFFPWIFGLAVDVEAWPGVMSPWFPLLWVIVVDPFFITSDYTIQKTLSFMAAFHMWKIGVQRFSASCGTQFPCFWIIPNDVKRYEIVCWVTPNVNASSFCVWHKSSSNNSNSVSSYTFGFPLRSLSSTSNSPFLNFWNYSRNFFHLKQHNHMLLQAIYEPQLQISSN